MAVAVRGHDAQRVVLESIGGVDAGECGGGGARRGEVDAAEELAALVPLVEKVARAQHKLAREPLAAHALLEQRALERALAERD